MGTPAAAALDGARGGGAGAAGGAGSVPSGQGAGGAQPAGGGAGGSGAANEPFWTAWTAPEQKEVREWIGNKGYSDPFTLAKQTRELERELGSAKQAASLKGYPAPVKNPDGTLKAPDENQVRAWRTANGVPETADKYDIPAPSLNPYPQFKGFMAEEFHKIGVPAAMAPQLAAGYEAAVARLETELRKTEDTQSQEALLKLEQDWGPQFKERMSFAARGKEWLAKESGGMDETQLRVLEATLGTSKFLTMMWKLGAGNGEGKFASEGTGANAFGNGSADAQERLNEMTAKRQRGEVSDMAWREFVDKELPGLQSKIVAGYAPPA